MDKETTKDDAANKTVATKAAQRAAKNGTSTSEVAATSKDASKPGAQRELSAFVKKQRQRLLDLLDELDASAHEMAEDALQAGPHGSEASGAGVHQGDAGSDAYDRDLALNILSKEQDALYEVEDALRRIEKGVYGICEISGKRISNQRLEAIPFCRLTVDCQAQWEEKYGKTRFRREDEVGYIGGL